MNRQLEPWLSRFSVDEFEFSCLRRWKCQMIFDYINFFWMLMIMYIWFILLFGPKFSPRRWVDLQRPSMKRNLQSGTFASLDIWLSGETWHRKRPTVHTCENYLSDGDGIQRKRTFQAEWRCEQPSSAVESHLSTQLSESCQRVGLETLSLSLAVVEAVVIEARCVLSWE